MVKIQCETCGKEFETKNKKSRFCSYPCQNKWQKEKRPKPPNKKITKECEICKRRFTIKLHRKDTAKYCSWECNHKSKEGKKSPFNRRINFSCLQCGRQFEVKHHRKNTAKFCSPECSAKYRGGHQEVKCLQCGKCFLVKSSRAEQTKFCSRKCQGLWRTRNLIGRNAAHYTKGRYCESIKTECNICGKTFDTNRATIECGAGKTCSKECLSKLHQRNIALIFASENGISLEEALARDRGRDSRNRLSGTKDYREWRKSIFIQDSFRCVRCGRESERTLEAHHLLRWRYWEDYWFDTRNGITLCKKCHSWVHSNVPGSFDESEEYYPYLGENCKNFIQWYRECLRPNSPGGT